MRTIDADALIEFCAERWIPLNIDAVNMQPTIQPEERTEKRTETHGVCLDAISRKPAIDALDKQIKQCCKALGSLSLSDVDKHAVEVKMASLRAYREMLENLPTVQPEPQWIPVSERLPEDLVEVNVTWVNRNPESYYEPIKDKLFTTTAVYYKGEWYWLSATCVDYLAEYGRCDWNKVDKAIEIIAWMPLPEAYKPNNE